MQIEKLTAHPHYENCVFLDLRLGVVVLKGILVKKEGAKFKFSFPIARTYHGVRYTLICPDDIKSFQEEISALLAESNIWEAVNSAPRPPISTCPYCKDRINKPKNAFKGTAKELFDKGRTKVTPDQKYAARSTLKSKIESRLGNCKKTKEYLSLDDFKKQKANG